VRINLFRADTNARPPCASPHATTNKTAGPGVRHKIASVPEKNSHVLMFTLTPDIPFARTAAAAAATIRVRVTDL
jgi:hypothetical protein